MLCWSPLAITQPQPSKLALVRVYRNSLELYLMNHSALYGIMMTTCSQNFSFAQPPQESCSKNTIQIKSAKKPSIDRKNVFELCPKWSGKFAECQTLESLPTFGRKLSESSSGKAHTDVRHGINIINISFGKYWVEDENKTPRHFVGDMAEIALMSFPNEFTIIVRFISWLQETQR